MAYLWKARSNGAPRSTLEVEPSLIYSSLPCFDSKPKAIPPIILSILKARGIEESNFIDKFLNPKLTELRDPFLLLNMDKAVDRLLKAFDNQENILIYGDFDLDGTSGVALLKTAFEKFGYKNIKYFQPSRLKDGYGLHAKVIEQFKREHNIQVIVTVDVGITGIAGAKKAKDLNVDLIITDHHLAQEELPDALAVVNPNLPSCESKLGHLCGAGVAFYLCWALRRLLISSKRLDPKKVNLELKELLDCFVIGTLTDMVPLIEENRSLVKNGLKVLSQTQRPGLRLLLQELDLLNRPLTGADVAIKFAPKLNALSRTELNLMPLDLFLVKDEKEAYTMVQEVLKTNQYRVELQKEAEKVAVSIAELQKDLFCILVVSSDIHRGVAGLVATKLCQNYNKPCFVGAIDPVSGQVIGSARVPNGSKLHLVEALDSASDFLVKFGGHAQAAGFELEVGKEELVKKSLNNYFANVSANIEAKVPGGAGLQELIYDVELPLFDFNTDLMDWLDVLGPFGTQFAAPIFLIRDVQVRAVRTLKGGHLRLSLRSNLDKNIEALFFSPTEWQLKKVSESSLIDVLVELQWNYFMGRKTIQLMIKEVRTNEEEKSS